jgi:hypothetical protein
MARQKVQNPEFVIASEAKQSPGSPPTACLSPGEKNSLYSNREIASGCDLAMTVVFCIFFRLSAGLSFDDPVKNLRTCGGRGRQDQPTMWDG